MSIFFGLFIAFRGIFFSSMVANLNHVPISVFLNRIVSSLVASLLSWWYFFGGGEIGVSL